MKLFHFSLIFALLLMMTTMCIAQMDQQMQNRATVEPGPVVRTGLPASADVFVDGRFALRIPASAGGLTPMQRAQTIANRLNAAFDQGMSWEDMRVAQVRGLWTVSIDGNIIATADVNSARAFGTTTASLANRWARQTVVALGGQPQMIAQQLQPIPGAVAGAVEELGAVNWMVTPVRSVPLLNAATGDQMGMITVAGAQNRLNQVNAVAAYQYMSDGAVVWTFVPISGTSVTDDLQRVMGVGVVQISADMLPMANLMTGNEVMQMVTTMGNQWNTMITSRLAQNDLQLQGSAKIVPLYSLTMNQVVGAAQVVGDASAVAQTQAVALSTVDGNFAFNATTMAPAQITGQPSTQNNVVVSSLILFPQAGQAPVTTTPTTPPAEMPPSVETPEETSEGEMSPPSP